VAASEFQRLCRPSTETLNDGVTEQVARISDVQAGLIDGDAFFRRNHFTEGLNRLVRTGFERLAGKSDTGAFYLTQAMGGGKTHSLIAMALLAKDEGLRQRAVPEIARANPFGAAKVIFFDGHNSPQNFLWGNIADQLGRPDAMKRFWSGGAQAPGVDDWVATIGKDEPVLILLDELPSYLQMAAGITVANSTLADQTVIALERLFNALPQLPRACVIVTNLKDDVYQDGSGKLKSVIDSLSKHYDRNAVAITPVQQNSGEVFEIVRKRLFDELPDAARIEEVGQAFVDALDKAKRVDSLPSVPETYLSRIRETYPFHPSIRDVVARFNENRGYQKTRALIRLLRHAVRGAMASAYPVYLVGLQHLDFNDQQTLEEIRKINAAYTNAIAKDVADKGNATAEKIDAAEGRPHASAVAKLLLMASLSSATNPVRGLRESEISEALVDPLVRVSDLKSALEALQGQCWYLQRDAELRIYFSQTQNVTAEINDVASNIPEEQVDDMLRAKLREVFKPIQGDVYDGELLILPAKDELSVIEDRVRLIILEHKADELPREFEDWWKAEERQNSVLLLTADPNAVRSMRNLARRMRAIDLVEKSLKQRQNSAQQLEELEGIKGRDTAGFASAVREAFKTVIYPVTGALRMYADFRMEFSHNDYRGEEQIRNTLIERKKFIPATAFNEQYENLRLDAEEMLFDADSVQMSALRRKAALQPGWYWLPRGGLEQLVRMAIQRGHWREKDGLIQKRWERRAEINVRIDEFAPDPIETGHYTLAIATQDADTIYYSEKGAPDPAQSAKLSGLAYELRGAAVWFLAVDSMGKNKPSEPFEFRAPIRLRVAVESTPDGKKLTAQAVPRAATIHASFDGTDPRQAPVFTSPGLIPDRATQLRVIAGLDGAWSQEEVAPLATGVADGPGPKKALDDNKPLQWEGRYQSTSTDQAFDAIEYLRATPGVTVSGALFEMESKRIEGELMSLRVGTPISGTAFDELVKALAEKSGFETPAATLRLMRVAFTQGRDFREFARRLKLDFERETWKQEP
jgi:hypothetical protein